MSMSLPVRMLSTSLRQEENAYTTQSYIPIITIQKKATERQQKCKLPTGNVNFHGFPLFFPNPNYVPVPMVPISFQQRQIVLPQVINDVRNVESQLPTNIFINANDVNRKYYPPQPLKTVLLLENLPTLPSEISGQDVVLESIEVVPKPTNSAVEDLEMVIADAETEDWREDGEQEAIIKAKNVVKKENPEKYFNGKLFTSFNDIDQVETVKPHIGNLHEEKIKRKLQSLAIAKENDTA